MDRWGFIISHIGYTFLVDCPTPSKWKIRKHCGTTCHSLLTQWIWIWYGYGCVNVKPTPPTQWNSKQPWLRPLAPPHLLAATLLERPRTNQLPAFSRTILYFPNNCRCSQALSLRLRRPRSLGSVTAVQFSKSWGDPELGHDPAFTPRARSMPHNRAQSPVQPVGHNQGRPRNQLSGRRRWVSCFWLTCTFIYWYCLCFVCAEVLRFSGITHNLILWRSFTWNMNSLKEADLKMQCVIACFMMSPYPSDQLSERSHVPATAL